MIYLYGTSFFKDHSSLELRYEVLVSSSPSVVIKNKQTNVSRAPVRTCVSEQKGNKDEKKFEVEEK